MGIKFSSCGPLCQAGVSFFKLCTMNDVRDLMIISCMASVLWKDIFISCVLEDVAPRVASSTELWEFLCVGLHPQLQTGRNCPPVDEEVLFHTDLCQHYATFEKETQSYFPRQSVSNTIGIVSSPPSGGIMLAVTYGGVSTSGSS